MSDQISHHDPPHVNHVRAHDHAAIVATAILAVIRDALSDALNDPALHAHIATTLRFELTHGVADAVREVFDSRPNSGEQQHASAESECETPAANGGANS